MFHRFPSITHIDQVMPVVEACDDFRRFDTHPHFNLVAYFVMQSGTFKGASAHETALRRECRGLLFHKDGSVARRAFHKFFNVNEAEETFVDNLDLSKPHHVLEKLDGSMIAPFISRLDGEVYWASMRGSSDYHERVKSHFGHTAYEDLVRAMAEQNLTAIFEFCSTETRIVIDYGTPKMTILALRNRTTGEYIRRSDLLALGQEFGVPVVKPFEHDTQNIEELVDCVRQANGAEGSVIWFEDGRLVKLKGEWYTQLHKLLAYFDFEKDIARLILSGNQDDLLGLLNPERRAKFVAYQDELLEAVKAIVGKCETARDEICKGNVPRKDFATSFKHVSPTVKAIMFKVYDNLEDAEFTHSVMAAALSNTSKKAKWDKFKLIENISLVWDVENI